MDTIRNGTSLLLTAIAAGALSGCASPYRADQGALFGGLTGAGLGAIIGEAVDQPLAGAVIGGAAGTLTGAAIGGSLDEIEARNRAEIAARLGRPAPVGSVTTSDVVAMSQSGVHEQIIITHVERHGIAAPLGTHDLIMLQNSGVSPAVIQAMQRSPGPVRPVAVAVPAEPPVIIERHYYDDPWGPPPFRYRHWHHTHHHRHHRPNVSWGLSFSN